jgi:hypothetical protein
MGPNSLLHRHPLPRDPAPGCLRKRNNIFVLASGFFSLAKFRQKKKLKEMKLKVIL